MTGPSAFRRPLVLATLGPRGSNHDWVAHRYLAALAVADARVALFGDFDAAFAALLAGDADAVLQVAVHPETARSVGRYRGRAHLIDAFLSPSQAMAVLTRADVQVPGSIGYQAATADYVDLGRWQRHVPEPTTIDVWAGLEAGRYESGLTLQRFADERPGAYRIDEVVGTVTDAWLVYAREPVTTDLLVWPESPAAGYLRRLGRG